MEEINIVIAIISFLILGMGLIKANIKRSYLSEPLIALLIGVVTGPQILEVINPFSWKEHHEILHEFTRFTLALAVMASALRLPTNFLRKNLKSYLLILLAGMVLMVILSSLFYFIFGLGFWESLLIGAILAPTDPVLATAIVSSNFAYENIPARLRNMITAESASNDGLAFAFVLLPIVAMGRHDLPLIDWAKNVLLWQNIGAIILGVILGYFTGKAFRFFHKKESMVPKTLMAIALSFTILVTTLFPIIKMNGIIGVFAAGVAFQALVGDEIETRHEEVQSMMERLFIVPVFVIFGAMLPWTGWKEMPLYAWIITPFVIFLRRIPTLFVLKPFLPVFSTKDTFFMGWFGPIGVAALFYVTLLLTRYPGHEQLWPIVAYAVLFSTVIHAVTANPFSRRLYHNQKENSKIRHDASNQIKSE